jgi:mono/diheme cytochrome c family protein
MKRALIAVLLAVLAAVSASTPVSAQTLSKAEKGRLIRTGAKLWGVYCNQCHNARPPSEKAPYEWDQEIMHMRTLGNIPAADARAIVEYLKTR